MSTVHEAEEPTQQSYSDDQESSTRAPLVLHWALPEEQGTVLFAGTKITIGRGIDCDLRLCGSNVSRLHAEAVKQGAIWTLRDRQSTNGTYLNGRRVEDGLLMEGSVVRIGSFVGLVDRMEGDTVLPDIREISPGFWGSTRLEAVIAPALKAAKSNLPLVIEGDTGTGKERVARAVHAASERPGQFVAFNCASVPENLAEAQFFGHVKGAFTGAAQPTIGYFRASDRGTLFLDEVAELPFDLQAKLLRALQEREVTPVGAHKAIPLDLRVVVASQRPLEHYVRLGTFRRDLMMRLNGLSVRLPALCERVHEIPWLLRLFSKRAARNGLFSVEPKLMEALCCYSWPGNVRQLELIAQRLVALSGSDSCLKYSDLPPQLVRDEKQREVELDAQVGRDAQDLTALSAALRETSGNVSAAAKLAKVSRQRAYRLLNRRTDSLTFRASGGLFRRDCEQ